jgi:hypothetical protein
LKDEKGGGVLEFCHVRATACAMKMATTSAIIISKGLLPFTRTFHTAGLSHRRPVTIHVHPHTSTHIDTHHTLTHVLAQTHT